MRGRFAGVIGGCRRRLILWRDVCSSFVRQIEFIQFTVVISSLRLGLFTRGRTRLSFLILCLFSFNRRLIFLFVRLVITIAIFFGIFILHFIRCNIKHIATEIIVTSAKRIVIILSRMILHGTSRHYRSSITAFSFQIHSFGILFGIRFIHLLSSDLIHLFHNSLDKQFCRFSQSMIGMQIIRTDTLHASERTTKSTFGKCTSNTRFTGSASFHIPREKHGILDNAMTNTTLKMFWNISRRKFQCII
jgi:hypothetical protein